MSYIANNMGSASIKNMHAMNRWNMAVCTLIYPLHLFFFFFDGDIKFFLLKFIHVHPFEVTIIQKAPNLF